MRVTRGTGFGKGSLRGRVASVAIAALAAVPTGVGAFDIPTGNEDLVMRWDNTASARAGQSSASTGLQGKVELLSWREDKAPPSNGAR